MNNRLAKSGFTLIEVLVSISVIVLVIVAATNIVVSIIRSNSENVHTLIAYGLAQEGLEGLRNIRDSNWLLDAKFNGKIGPVDIWGAPFPDSMTTEYYTIDFGVLERNLGVDITTPNELPAHTPWKLSSITQDAAENMADSTELKKFVDESINIGEVHYAHGELFANGEPTPFHRYVTVQNVSDVPQEVEKLRVSSVVNWIEYGRKKEVRLDSIFTDWNQGQL